MLIACINFMNLYTANSEMRAKEIGMRKVLGASVASIIGLLLQGLLKLLLIASLVAWPVAYFAMRYALSLCTFQGDHRVQKLH